MNSTYPVLFSALSRDIRGRDPSYIFICRSVISRGKIRNEKKSAERRKEEGAKRRRENRGAEDLDREESSLHDIGTGARFAQSFDFELVRFRGTQNQPLPLPNSWRESEERGKWRREKKDGK